MCDISQFILLQKKTINVVNMLLPAKIRIDWSTCRVTVNGCNIKLNVKVHAYIRQGATVVTFVTWCSGFLSMSKDTHTRLITLTLKGSECMSPAMESRTVQSEFLLCPDDSWDRLPTWISGGKLKINGDEGQQSWRHCICCSCWDVAVES